MDPVQLTIIAVSFILTGLIAVLSVQVWQILKEVRIMFGKMNKMLDDMGKVTGTVGEGFSSVGGFISGLKSGLSLFTSLRKGESDDE